MSFSPNLNRKNKSADVAFFIYFTLMALFFSKTYIQLAAQVGIIVYVMYIRFLKERRYTKIPVKNVKFMVLWMGLFALLAVLSQFWAYGVKGGVSTTLNLIKVFVIGVTIFIYVADYTKAVSVIKSFIYSNLVMAIVVLLTTPLSQYGKSGDEGFGNVIRQQRNTFGAVMAFLVLLCIVFYQYEGMRYGKILAAFFVVALLCSGSRGAILQLIIIAVLYVVTMPGLKRKFKYITAAVFVGIVAVIVMQNVPYLYDTVWVRFENMINTVLGIEAEADMSAKSRELYKVLAYDMFEKKPLLGYGVDGFLCYLRDIQYIEGYYVEPNYSHCNYTELAADFGIVGLIIWYLPIFSVWLGSFKLRKKAMQMNLVFITLTSMIILDYARIPWSNQLGAYTYFCVILLYFWVRHEINKKRRIRFEQYEVWEADE